MDGCLCFPTVRTSYSPLDICLFCFNFKRHLFFTVRASLNYSHFNLYFSSNSFDKISKGREMWLFVVSLKDAFTGCRRLGCSCFTVP